MTRPEMFPIYRLDHAAKLHAEGAPRLANDLVVVSAERLCALLERSEGDPVSDEVIEAVGRLYPHRVEPTRIYVRAPEGACDVLLVEDEGSTCVGCGWPAEDHDEAVQEASRREVIEAAGAEEEPSTGGEA